jgi:Uncharacterized conserved protein (DUF2293)
MFHGEPTVGLQPGIPLSRRVQLAVLAHIRHTHTRYDQLLKETSWMNARKAVEPVCLDVLVKWRGDEETGRDQMDEILREVVIITDSEESDESSEEDDSSDEEDETSSSSSGSISRPASRDRNRSALPQTQVAGPREPDQHNRIMDREGMASAVVSLQNPPKDNSKAQRDKKTQRGFKRYQAAWDEAVSRRKAPKTAPADMAFEDPTARRHQQGNIPPIHDQNKYTVETNSEPRLAAYRAQEQGRYPDPITVRRPVSLLNSYSTSSINVAARRLAALIKIGASLLTAKNTTRKNYG